MPEASSAKAIAPEADPPLPQRAPPRLMRLPDVIAATGYSAPSIYRLVKQGRFPRPVHLLDGRAAAWVADEVYAVIDAAIAKREDNNRNHTAKASATRAAGKRRRQASKRS